MGLAGHVEELALADVYLDPADHLYKVKDSLLLTPSFGAIWYLDLDLGFPDIRDSVQAFPDSDGVYDSTQFHGARAVTLSLLVLEDAFSPGELAAWGSDIPWQSSAYWVKQLSSWMTPYRRPRLFFKLKGEDAAAHRWIDLRSSNFTAPIVMSDRSTRNVTLSWQSASGKIRSFDPSTLATHDGRTVQLISLVGQTDAGGRAYPLAHPRTYGAPATGAGSVTYKGTARNGFQARVTANGYATVDPRITLTSPDGVTQSVGFTGLSMAAGDSLLIDTDARTVVLNGTTNVAQYLSAPLQWPQLKPGIGMTGAGAGVSGYNAVGFVATVGAGSGAQPQVEIMYHSADLA